MALITTTAGWGGWTRQQRGSGKGGCDARSQRSHMRWGQTCQLTARPRGGWGRLCLGWGALQGLPPSQTLSPGSTALAGTR